VRIVGETFCDTDFFWEGCFVEGHLVEGNLLGGTFCSEGCYVVGCFVLAQKIRPYQHEEMYVNGNLA
jgi:hypothetical protein